MTEREQSPVYVLFAQGPVDDADAVRRRWDDWHERMATGSWQGSTGGIASAGEWLAAIRYSSEEAARAAADDEVGQAFFSGATTVELTGDVQLVKGNGSPVTAGFVQFMRARVLDRHRLEAVEAAVGDRFARFRRDFLAGLRAWTGPDRLTVVDWFTSEAEARAGEGRPIPAELGALFSEWMSLLQDVEWYDLAQSWQAAPGSDSIAPSQQSILGRAPQGNGSDRQRSQPS